MQRAAAFNRSLTRRAEAARAISPAAAVQEPLPPSFGSPTELLAAPSAGDEQPQHPGSPGPRLGSERAQAEAPEQTPAEASQDRSGALNATAVHAADVAQTAEEAHADGSASAADTGASGLASAPANHQGEQALEAQGTGETAGSNETQDMPEQAGTAAAEQDKGTSTGQTEQGRISDTEMEQGMIASTPRAGPNSAAREAPPAEQLLPALMRQVMPGCCA